MVGAVQRGAHAGLGRGPSGRGAGATSEGFDQVPVDQWEVQGQTLDICSIWAQSWPKLAPRGCSPLIY